MTTVQKTIFAIVLTAMSASSIIQTMRISALQDRVLLLELRAVSR